jgi:hypothetical protein
MTTPVESLKFNQTASSVMPALTAPRIHGLNVSIVTWLLLGPSEMYDVSILPSGKEADAR